MRTISLLNSKLEVGLGLQVTRVEVKTKSRKEKASSENGNADAFFSKEKQLNRIWLTRIPLRFLLNNAGNKASIICLIPPNY